MEDNKDLAFMRETEDKERIKKNENYKIDNQVEMKSRIFMKAKSVMCF